MQHRPFSYGFYQTPRNLLTTIKLGITSVRDAGGADAGLRMAVRDGLLVGPRMQVSITMLSQTGGHNDEVLPSGGISAGWQPYPGFPSGVCDGVDGVRQKVREVIRAGADVIKIASSGGFFSPNDDPMHPHFSQEELDVIVSVIIYATKMGVELTALGIPVIVAGEAWVRNKGLTQDATSKAHYFELLSQLPLAGRYRFRLPGTRNRLRPPFFLSPYDPGGLRPARARRPPLYSSGGRIE